MFKLSHLNNAAEGLGCALARLLVATHARQIDDGSLVLLLKAAVGVAILVDDRVRFEAESAVVETLLLAIQQQLVVEAGNTGVEAPIQDEVVHLVGHFFIF